VRWHGGHSVNCAHINLANFIAHRSSSNIVVSKTATVTRSLVSSLCQYPWSLYLEVFEGENSGNLLRRTYPSHGGFEYVPAMEVLNIFQSWRS
jgi:hypothetical protein